MRITFDQDAIILSYAKSREPLYQGNVSDIGLVRIGNKYLSKTSDRKKLFAGSVVAWIMLKPRH
jgi:hypothetical protein